MKPYDKMSKNELLQELKRRDEQAAEALRKTEECYHDHIGFLDIGYQLCQIICDDSGIPRDYRYLVSNRHFEKETGLKSAEVNGKTVLELFPDVETSWIETYGKVALTGESILFEKYNHNTGRLYEVFAFRPAIGQFAALGKDITEHKQAQMALCDSEQRYRALFMSMKEGYFLTQILYDDNGVPCDYSYLDVNPAFEQIIGFQRAQIIGKRLKELFPNFTPLWLEVFIQVAESGSPCHFCYFSEPFARHFEVYVFKLAGDNVAALVTDITESRQTKQALQKSETLLRLFIEHAPASIAMLDRNMGYISASRRWRENYQLGELDLAGVSHYDLFPEITPEWREAHRRGLAGEVLASACERVQRGNGSVQWLRWEIQPWYDGSKAIGGILIFTEDITDLKQSEAALRKSEERYRDIVENQTEYVGRYLPGGIFTFVNSALASIPALKPEQLVGQSFYQFLHEDDRERVVMTVESLSAKNPIAVVENRVTLADGLHWLQWKHCALTDEAGNIVEFQATGRDITQFKRMQDNLIKNQNDLELANELLEQRVCERTSDLEAAIREQEAFSYSVSHDLRAPLRHINSFSKILIEDHGDELSAQARSYLNRICASSVRMGKLIDHLLELSRFTRAAIKVEAVDLSELAAATLCMFQETEPNRCVEYQVEPGMTVKGDRTMLRQLLENLIGNAWKYTSKKPLACIQFRSDLISGQETFFVKDNGVGFDAAYSEKLFNPFERLHGTEFEGIGIGLTTAQRIVGRHGGTIWAEGELGKGATLYFTVSKDLNPGVAERFKNN